MNIHIEAGRLILRPFTESDAAAANHNSKQPTAAHFMPDIGIRDSSVGKHQYNYCEVK